MRKYFLPLIGLFCLSVYAQPVSVELNEYAKAKRDNATPLFIPTFRFKTTTLKDYSRFGIVEKKATPTFSIVLPPMQNCRDTAYGFIYFGGLNNNKGGYLTFLISNYKRRPNIDCYFILDRNANNNFNDDTWDTLKWNQLSYTIQVCKSANCDYAITMTRPLLGDEKKRDYYAMQDHFYQTFDSDTTYTSYRYGFTEKRFHFKKGLATTGNDTFRIGVRDFNENGHYDDPGDRVYVLTPNDSIFDDDRYFEIVKGTTTFEWKRTVYRVVSIAPDGSRIRFEPDVSARSQSKLVPGKKIPKFTYHPWEDVSKDLSVKKYRRKQLYIYFFRTQLERFAADSIYLNRIQKEFGDKITVLCLTVNDYPKFVTLLMAEHPPWKLGAASPELIRLYNIEELPMGIYCGKRRKLIHAAITPQELYETLIKSAKK